MKKKLTSKIHDEPSLQQSKSNPTLSYQIMAFQLIKTTFVRWLLVELTILEGSQLHSSKNTFIYPPPNFSSKICMWLVSLSKSLLSLKQLGTISLWTRLLSRLSFTLGCQRILASAKTLLLLFQRWVILSGMYIQK